jgi:beta-phosphoglucomutase
MPQAIIFDFDGVITDTEPLHYDAFARVLPGFDIQLSRETYFARYTGLSDREILRRILADGGRHLPDDACVRLLRDKDAAYRRRIRRGIEPLAGLRSFVEHAARHVPLAICSGSKTLEIEMILREIDIDAFFQTIVAAEDVPVSKPDPAGYLLALARIRSAMPDLMPDGCLVFEDSEAGIAAARSAAMRVIAVRKDYPVAGTNLADAIIEGFDGLTLQKIESLLAG